MPKTWKIYSKLHFVFSKLFNYDYTVIMPPSRSSPLGQNINLFTMGNTTKCGWRFEPAENIYKPCTFSASELLKEMFPC